MNKAFGVVYPYCGHKYTTIVLNAEESDFLIRRADQKEKGWIDKCPACGETTIVLENTEYAVKESDLKFEEVVKFVRLT